MKQKTAHLLAIGMYLIGISGLVLLVNTDLTEPPALTLLVVSSLIAFIGLCTGLGLITLSKEATDAQIAAATKSLELQ